MSRKKAVVVVLGDIGRSPRICNHAFSLTSLAFDVTMVGYLDTKPHAKIAENEHITFEPMPSSPAWIDGISSPALQMFLKLVCTFFLLLYTLLFKVGWKCDLVLMQNPPAIPTAPVCWFVARLKGAHFVIDWHNYMYSILRDKYNLPANLTFDQAEPQPEPAEPPKEQKDAVKRRREERNPQPRKKSSKAEKVPSKSIQHRLVELVYWLEKYFGRMADGGLCVTKAMQKDLMHSWGVPSAVFYDRPPSWAFGSTTEEEKHDLFMRLGQQYPAFGAKAETNSNILTELKDGRVVWKEDRPMVVISSTSWTPDEDFSILLDAIIKYNDVARIAMSSVASKRVPPLLLIITGKGPLKSYYLDRIARHNMDKVKVITPWLEAADYPKMLAAADIGVSLHTSTSGMDLPMKVVDMFGSGIPVLAKNFACIGELVESKKNGLLFDTANDLYQHLMALATGFPTHSQDLMALKENVTSEKLATWEETWPTTVSAVVTPPENYALQRVLAREPESDDDD